MRRFLHAFRGIAHAVRSERNFAIHLPVAVLAFALAFQFGLSGTEFALLILTVGGVLTAEMLNTAVERVVDLASPDHHELAKDVAAGAVLIAAVAAIAVGLLVLGPPLRAWIAA